MSIKQFLETEMERLQVLRSELNVQAHLAKADAKDEVKQLWEKAEQARVKLEADFSRIRDGAEEPMDEIGAAARNLADEIKQGYHRIKTLMKG